MEKIAIQLWKKNDIDEDEFKNFLVKKVPSSLADIVSNYQVNIVDKRIIGVIINLPIITNIIPPCNDILLCCN